MQMQIRISRNLKPLRSVESKVNHDEMEKILAPRAGLRKSATGFLGLLA